MRIIVGFLGVLLLTGSLGSTPQQQQDAKSCGFTVQGEPTQATVAGPDDIVPLAYVIEQPDSPIEIVSVDLEGMWLSVSGEEYTYRHCAKYKVRNRSDRAIQRFGIELQVSDLGPGGGSFPWISSPLAPGQTVETKACGGGGRGGARQNHVRVLVYVGAVDFGDCLYRASLRIPRSLGLRAP